MTQLRRSLEVTLTACALTAVIAMQLTSGDPFEQILANLETTTCYKESEACLPKLASAWQFFKPFKLVSE
ncbi:MAG: hypothetical protein AAF289_09100 [Cyanobacteria bacterium P01_A01_bin.135]